MLKKVLFVVGVLMMATPAFASWTIVHGAFNPEAITSDRSVDWERDGDNIQRKAETWNWPASYDAIPICILNVRMEVGFWIRLDGCRNKNIDLKQVQIDKYQGRITCTAKANVATVWSAEFTKNDGIDLSYGVDYCLVDPSSLPGPTTGTPIVVKLGLKDVNLQNLTPSNSCWVIGKVTVKVKPDVRPNQYMSGCSGDGAGFGTPTYPYYAPPPVQSY